MDFKRWLMATLGACGVIAVSEYLIHNVWLGEFYRMHAQWWRSSPEMAARMGFLVGGQIALAGLLTLVYARGYEAGKGTVAQGFRFGVLMALLLFLPTCLVQYCIYPYPLSLILNWLLGGFVEITLAGLMIGYLYKPAKR